MNKRGSNVLDISSRLPTAKAFKSVGVLLSEMGSGSIAPDDRKLLLSKMREKVRTLKAELDGDGTALRSRVVSYLRTMAGGREDELSGSGVDFRVPEKKIEISLEPGEADKKSASRKIDRIVAECTALAAEDLEFLESASKKVRTSSLDDSEIEQLRSVLENNTYWRFLEAN